MDEVIASLQGCALILAEMDDGDPRLWAVISALRRAVEILEEIDEPEAAPDDENGGI